MIFETHAHYDDPAFDEDRESLLLGSLTVEYKKNACRPYKTCFFYVKFFTFISVILCHCVL